MVNGKEFSVFTKKTTTSHNSRYIHGQFDLGGGVLKVADINTRSIKLVELATETPEKPTEISGNEEVSTDPIIQYMMMEVPVKSRLLTLRINWGFLLNSGDAE